MEKVNFDLTGFIERYKVLISVILLVFIAAGSAFLLWRENIWKPRIDSEIASLETRIASLESGNVKSDSADLDKLIAGSQNGENSEQSATSPIADQNQSQPKSAQPAATTSGKININTASASILESLPKIGPVLAGKIIEYRQLHGGFKSIKEIDNVSGIGEATYNKIKDLITI